MSTHSGVKPDLYFSADISKVDPLDDGTVVVYGIPCMPGVLDNDKQMVDPAWLKQALSEWYATGPNIREMHQPIAAGKGTELDWKGDVPYLTAKVIDPLAAKKVREGVLKAFSIGVKGPITKRKNNAPAGLIVGGKIIEVTLCDRPCIPGSDILDFKADLFKMAAFIEDDEVLDYQRGVAWKCAPIDVGKRDMDPNVGGGVDRDKIPAEDFAGKNRSFPIVDPKDVSDAATSIGQAGDDNYPAERLKRNIIRIARRKGAAFVAELPESWKTNKETKVADTDTTEKDAVVDDGVKTVDAATEKAAELEESAAADDAKTDETAKSDDVAKAEGILAELAEKAAKSAYCGDCSKTMEIHDGKTKTVKGNKMLVGTCEKGHRLTKFIPTDGDADDKASKSDDVEEAAKAAGTETKAEEADKTVEAAAEKASDDVEAAKAAGEEKAEVTEAVKAAGITDTAVLVALNTLLKAAGIDLAKVAQETTKTRAELLSAKLDEFQDLTDRISKSAESGGTTTLSGLDTGTINELRSIVSDINALADQMAPGDGKFLTDESTTKGTVDMGESHVATPVERTNLQRADMPDMKKSIENESHVDAAELAKVLGAEMEKVLTPLHERLAEVEHSVKPASAPVFVVEERGSAFVGKRADATQMALHEAREKLAALSDDDRAKLAAAMLANSKDWSLGNA